MCMIFYQNNMRFYKQLFVSLFTAPTKFSLIVAEKPFTKYKDTLLLVPMKINATICTNSRTELMTCTHIHTL